MFELMLSMATMLTAKISDTYKYIVRQFPFEKSLYCVLNALKNHPILMK